MTRGPIEKYIDLDIHVYTGRSASLDLKESLSSKRIPYFYRNVTSLIAPDYCSL